jgi:hypothetical protein
MWKFQFVGLWLMSLLISQSSVRGEERHYMLIFASQGQPTAPRTSHTFAVFVKAKGEGAKDIERHCISWMPQNLQIETLRPTPVAGKNLTLDESLRYARSISARVTLWGPFLIRPELYAMAVEQANRLKANAVEYIVLDGARRGVRASNCIHAVSDLDNTRSRLSTGTAYGDLASQMVLRYFERYILENDQPTQWLTDHLKLKSDEIRFATTEATQNTSIRPMRVP